MAFRTRYDVRVIEDGELVTKKRFAAKDAALNFAADKLVRRRRVTIARKRVFSLRPFRTPSGAFSRTTPGCLHRVLFPCSLSIIR
jgi:hypothetical protein